MKRINYSRTVLLAFVALSSGIAYAGQTMGGMQVGRIRSAVETNLANYPAGGMDLTALETILRDTLRIKGQIKQRYWQNHYAQKVLKKTGINVNGIDSVADVGSPAQPDTVIGKLHTIVQDTDAQHSDNEHDDEPLDPARVRRVATIMADTRFRNDVLSSSALDNFEALMEEDLFIRGYIQDPDGLAEAVTKLNNLLRFQQGRAITLRDNSTKGKRMFVLFYQDFLNKGGIPGLYPDVAQQAGLDVDNAARTAVPTSQGLVKCQQQLSDLSGALTKLNRNLRTGMSFDNSKLKANVTALVDTANAVYRAATQAGPGIITPGKASSPLRLQSKLASTLNPYLSFFRSCKNALSGKEGITGASTPQELTPVVLRHLRGAGGGGGAAAGGGDAEATRFLAEVRAAMKKAMSSGGSTGPGSGVPLYHITPATDAETLYTMLLPAINYDRARGGGGVSLLDSQAVDMYRAVKDKLIQSGKYTGIITSKSSPVTVGREVQNLIATAPSGAHGGGTHGGLTGEHDGGVSASNAALQKANKKLQAQLTAAQAELETAAEELRKKNEEIEKLETAHAQNITTIQQIGARTRIYKARLEAADLPTEISKAELKTQMAKDAAASGQTPRPGQDHGGGSSIDGGGHGGDHGGHGGGAHGGALTRAQASTFLARARAALPPGALVTPPGGASSVDLTKCRTLSQLAIAHPTAVSALFDLANALKMGAVGELMPAGGDPSVAGQWHVVNLPTELVSALMTGLGMPEGLTSAQRKQALAHVLDLVKAAENNPAQLAALTDTVKALALTGEVPPDDASGILAIFTGGQSGGADDGSGGALAPVISGDLTRVGSGQVANTLSMIKTALMTAQERDRALGIRQNSDGTVAVAVIDTSDKKTPRVVQATTTQISKKEVDAIKAAQAKRKNPWLLSRWFQQLKAALQRRKARLAKQRSAKNASNYED